MHSELLFARRDRLGSALRLLVCLLAAVGCNPYAQQEASSTSGTGGLGLQLKLSAEVTVTSITYQLLQGSELVRSGTFVPSPESDAFAGFVGGLPQATGYNLSLESNALLVDSQATTRCSGKASFGIVRGKTTTVAVRMRCEGVRGDELTPQTTPAGNHCPSISLLLAQPSTANLGEPIGLQGEALDPDMLPKPLSFRWSTPNGIGRFSSALDAVTSFVCTSAGGAELVLVVSDGDAACPFESSSVKVTCTASTDRKPAAAGAGASAPVGPQPAGAQAPANTSGQGSSGASMTAQPGPRAGQGSAHTWPSLPASAGNGAPPEPPAFDAGAPPIDPPPRDGEDDEEVPPPSDPQDSEPPGHDDGDPPPSDPQDSEPPGHDDGDPPPSWPGADAGQSPERDRGDTERDAGAHREGRNERNRDGGWPREGGGEGGRRGPRTETPAPDPDDAADAGASDEGAN